MLVRRVSPSRPTFDSPFADFDSVRREMLRLLDAVAGETFGGAGAGVFPAVNITQDDDNFYVRAEVPGIRPTEISISAVRNRVALAGERKIQSEHEPASYHRRERAEGSFNRTVTLPTEVDTERVDAKYSDGILTLTLPKAEEAKPRQIAVRT
ncbi:MAG TPA: Hsp20/alpha crystallin family protein [Chthoniobacterales bacterium]|jgi:HSP20 family protein|nr:Hsp20/alpha crystallin family protein [Chthoniobacterales bacterium]